MNFDLTPEIASMCEVVQRAAADSRDFGADEQWRRLSELGVFDLRGDNSPLPGAVEVGVVSVLDHLGQAALRGPFAESIWAGSDVLASAGGLVTMASTVVVGGETFVPYLQRQPRLLHAAGADPACWTVQHDPATRGADVPVERGQHAWAAAGGARPLAELEPAYAWRAAAATSAGLMSAVLDRTVEHARVRTQFGRTLASFQAVQNRLAECLWRVEGLRLIVREAAWRADRGQQLAEPVSALAWIYARRVSHLVARHCHQVLGAIGFTDEFGVTQLTGAAAVQRSVLPEKPAIKAVRAARAVRAGDPASSVLGGFVA